MTKAYEYVERGWCQRAYGILSDGTLVMTGSPQCSQVCLVGAIDAAYQGQGPDVWLAASSKIREVLRRRYPQYPEDMTLYKFNDLPTTTKEDVIALLKEAGV